MGFATYFIVASSIKKILTNELTKFKVDSTYSIVYNLLYWEDYPIQVFGFSDVDKKFHATMLAISSNENQWVYASIFDSLSKMGCNPDFVLGDGASAISSACKEVIKFDLKMKIPINILP